MTSNGILLEDTFEVLSINEEGKVYQRVSRIVCSNPSRTITIRADINTEEFPLSPGERLTIALANSLERSDQARQSTYDHSVYHRDTRLNDCDCAMHGRVYGFEKKESGGDVDVFISCGGLLTNINGPLESLQSIHYNSDVYILIKRVGK